MTRQGKTSGSRPQRSGGTGKAPPVGPDAMAGARIKAKWFLYRTGYRDLWEALGLAEAPAPTRRTKAAVAGRSVPPLPEPLPGHCPTCGNPIPKTGVCRKRLGCRAEAAKKEMQT